MRYATVADLDHTVKIRYKTKLKMFEEPISHVDPDYALKKLESVVNEWIESKEGGDGFIFTICNVQYYRSETHYSVCIVYTEYRL